MNITLEGETPKLAGWVFVGTLQHLADEGSEGVILRTVPGEHIPETYQTAERFCDHCKTNRFRRDTYVVRHDETGVFKQVGSNCIKDFLGHTDPQRYIKMAEYLSLLNDMLSSGDNGQGGELEPDHYSLHGFLNMTAKAIQHYGWLSKGKAWSDGGYATATRVQDKLSGIPKRMADADKQGLLDGENQEADDLAVAAEAWATDLEPGDNDYLHNVRVIALSGTVPSRGAGLAASIIAAYQREQSRAQEQEYQRREWGKEHVGEVGKREEFTLRLVFEPNGIETMYGISYLCKFADPDGNMVIWWASNPHFDNKNLVAGTTYKVRGTVKEHGEYNGIPQTAITRCKVLEELEA